MSCFQLSIFHCGKSCLCFCLSLLSPHFSIMISFLLSKSSCSSCCNSGLFFSLSLINQSLSCLSIFLSFSCSFNSCEFFSFLSSSCLFGCVLCLPFGFFLLESQLDGCLFSCFFLGLFQLFSFFCCFCSFCFSFSSCLLSFLSLSSNFSGNSVCLSLLSLSFSFLSHSDFHELSLPLNLNVSPVIFDPLD